MTVAFPKPSVSTNCPVLPTCCLVQIFSQQPLGRWWWWWGGGSHEEETVDPGCHRGMFRLTHTQKAAAHTHAVSVWRHTHAPKHLLRIITNPLRCLNLELFGSQCYLSWAYMTHQWEKYSKFEQRGRRESWTNNNVFRLWFFAARLCSQTGYCSSRKDQCHQMTRPLLHINISR